MPETTDNKTGDAGASALPIIGYTLGGEPIRGNANDGNGAGNSGSTGADSDADKGNGASGSGSTSDGPAGDDGDNSGNSQDGDGDSESKDPRIKQLADEAGKYRRKARESAAALEAMQKRLREFEDKDSTELEKAQREAKEAADKQTAYTDRIHKMAIENAFLRDNEYTWHNPARALALADLTDVEIDDEGKVTGLKDALKKLAKSDAYLLKTDTGNGQSSGAAVGSGRGGKDGVDRAALERKYPGIRR